MKRFLSILAVFAVVFAAVAEPPPAARRVSRIYRIFRGASANHRYEVVTNGAAVADFLDGSLRGLPVWNASTRARLSELGEARLLIVSSMLGDRLDVLVSGRPRVGSPLAALVAGWSAPDVRLARLVPANATVAFVSASSASGNPFELQTDGVRALTVDSFVSLLPAGSVTSGAAVVAAPAVAGDGFALVGAVRVARPGEVAAALGKLDGGTFASLFKLSRSGQRAVNGRAVHTYTLSSSVKDAADSKADAVGEFVRFSAVLADIFGPLTFEVTADGDLVVFEVGPPGDLDERLAAASGRTPYVSLSLLPIGMPSLDVSALRSVTFASPSTLARRGFASVTPAAASLVENLAPAGDGCTALAAVLPDGTFVWGWSLAENEVRGTIDDIDGVRPVFQALFLRGAESRILHQADSAPSARH